MSEPEQGLTEYLVISRGQWDEDAAPQDIQATIDNFYAWIENKISQGRVRHGSRLTREGATVTRQSVVTDGPFGEAKELIGGYWTLLAGSLDEAAAMAAENPCLKHGLFYEVRPLDPVKCDAFSITNETPGR